MIEQATGEELFTRLADSRARVLALARDGRLAPAALRWMADDVAAAAFDLHPMPVDPAAHVRAGYAFMRPYLERLPRHDPTRAVSVANEDGTTYHFRPRTVLRRVLDHALDHLDQIDQWLAWQAHGVVPTPADGWASSQDQLAEDALPLTQADLQAWLWRLDLVWGLLARRAARLTPAQLDWAPAADQWSLRRVLHHVARGFYPVWLEAALPEEPLTRYVEASRRLQERVGQVAAAPPVGGTVFFGQGALPGAVADIVAEVIAMERRAVEAAAATLTAGG